MYKKDSILLAFFLIITLNFLNSQSVFTDSLGVEFKVFEKNVPGTASVVINTEPQDADVYINGIYEGLSPLTIFDRNGYNRITVKKDGYKLVLYNVAGQRHPQLFNLNNDPYENRNLYGNPAYAKVQKKLTRLMYKMMEDAGDFCDPDKPDWGYPGKLTGAQVKEIQP